MINKVKVQKKKQLEISKFSILSPINKILISKVYINISIKLKILKQNKNKTKKDKKRQKKFTQYRKKSYR